MDGDEQIWQRFYDYTMTPHAGFIGVLRLARNIEVGGAVVECGVWHGGMIAGIATALGGGRRYHLFDSFTGLPAPDARDGQRLHDGRRVAEWARPGKFATEQSYAEQAMTAAGVDYEIHAGVFTDTLPGAQFPDGIAMLRLDADLYAAQRACLDHLFPHVNPGGLVIIDDYVLLPGCARAVADYLGVNQRCEHVQRLGGGPAVEAVWFLRKNPLLAPTQPDH